MLLSGGNLYRSVDRGINRMRTSYASSDGDNPDDDLLPSSAPTSSSSLLTMMMESPRELSTSGGGVTIVSQLDAQLDRTDHGSSSSSPSPQNGNCDRLHTEVVIAGGSRTHNNLHQHHHHHHQITTTTVAAAATATCNAYVMPDDNLYSTSTTRKRKISKMWETVTYGASAVVDGGVGGAVAAAAAGGNLFGHSLYNVIGRQQNEHDNRQPQKELRKDSTTKMANWRAGDEIDTTSLAADFDDSLSGLGVELGTASYNMSEALQALPTLPTFKQEPDSETGCATSTHVPAVTSQASTVNSSALSPHGGAGGGTGSGSAGNSNSGSGAGGNNNNHLLPSVSSSAYQVTAVAAIAASNVSPTVVNQYRFQYVLGAATSIATKMHEETLTYLNQGQSYEIKLKKLGDLNDCRGKLLKSIVRVCFHERRLQYMEKEQIANWKQGRPGERILEIDIPLSYGICDIVQGVVMSNVCEFVWDPTKETGVFVRVNCISTEFTPKKHGGEKGVPFRVQIETLSHGDGNPQRLHSASCQIKVFKPKGADRKHKTDREKMEKRSGNEQEKYQPSYDCTVLRECAVDTVYSAPAAPGGGGNGGGGVGGGVAVSSSMPQKTESVIFSSPSEQAPNTPTSLTADSPILDGVEALENSQTFDFMNMYQQPLPSESSASQTTQWLQANRFGSYVRTFTSFSAADILRLSREDLIQICGLADGIRLYNSLHSRAIRPRLTLYVCTESEQVYHAIYLENLTVEEMLSKLSTLINFQLQNINRVYVQGPSGIHVFITDEVIQNIQDESMFTIESVKDRSGDCYLLLKVSSPR